jgi:hypothetical protein
VIWFLVLVFVRTACKCTRSSAHNCSVRPQRVPFCADLLHQWRAGCKGVFVLQQSVAYIFGKYILFYRNGCGHRFFFKYGLDNRICRGILLEIGHLNCRIKQMSHVTLQTNFRQAPTKRPATTAAGPKTKKAKVAKARVVST